MLSDLLTLIPDIESKEPLSPSEQSNKRRAARVNYAELEALESEGDTPNRDAKRFQDMLLSRLPGLGNPVFDEFENGSKIDLPWIRRHGLCRPLLIHTASGLGLRTPPSYFTVRDVAQTLGHNWPIEVLDVASQSEVPGSWTLGEWAEYYHTAPSSRRRVLNVITLEFSGTPLAKLVRAPRFVRQIDWIDTVFPGFRRSSGEYPLVQLYCLMSVAGSWTDFHVDFGGTSVWYHVHTGSKTFIFLPPTPKALESYEQWTRSPSQSRTFFTDTLQEEEKRATFSITITAGQTLIIPSGYIHAVFTPCDSLVFGGNYLHGMAMDTQLRIYELELASKVRKKYRFPYYEHIQWYAMAYYVQFARLPNFKELFDKAQKWSGGHSDEDDSLCLSLSNVGLSIHELRSLPSLLKTLTHLRNSLFSRKEEVSGATVAFSSRPTIKGSIKHLGVTGEDEYLFFAPSEAATEAAAMAGCESPEDLLLELCRAIQVPTTGGISEPISSMAHPSTGSKLSLLAVHGYDESIPTHVSTSLYTLDLFKRGVTSVLHHPILSHPNTATRRITCEDQTEIKLLGSLLSSGVYALPRCKLGLYGGALPLFTGEEGEGGVDYFKAGRGSIQEGFVEESCRQGPSVPNPPSPSIWELSLKTDESTSKQMNKKRKKKLSDYGDGADADKDDEVEGEEGGWDDDGSSEEEESSEKRRKGRTEGSTVKKAKKNNESAPLSSVCLKPKAPKNLTGSAALRAILKKRR